MDMYKNATVLLVEDNWEILEANRKLLELEGYRVNCATTLAQAKELNAAHGPDIIVLDIMLPDGSGLEFCREVRLNQATPILFLTCLNDKQQLVEGLRAGGDDYLTKPYDTNELIARIEALLRRAKNDENPALAMGPLRLDCISMRAFVHGVDVLLKPKEFSILRILLENQHGYMKGDTLYRRVWATEAYRDARTVRVHICRLRQKLVEKGGKNFQLLYKNGQGYRLEYKEMVESA